HGLFLAQKTVAELRKIPGMKIYGRHAEGDGAVVSFLHENLHANDLASFLDARGFAIRTGHHCAQPLLRKFNIAATNRVSFWLYNTEHEVDEFISAITDICNKYA
ncbi:MAG: aminotransferase class V-fold PLP-dependent enzyme, partial [Euryarchaeota archaeon]|nr:aminotransferase class V-fold PLP-dependent enzyme [Euryarchaeota archaeon]